MTATYSGNPLSNDRDKLRFHIGDTDVDDAHLNDDELEFILSESGSFDRAVVTALEHIVHKLANEVSSSLGPTQVQAQQRFQHYKELLARSEERMFRARPWAGGISKSDKANRDRDTDRVDPFFRREGPDRYAKPRP